MISCESSNMTSVADNVAKFTQRPFHIIYCNPEIDEHKELVEGSLRAREALRGNVVIETAVRQLWSLVPKRQDLLITKKAYVKFLQGVALALIQNITESKAKIMAEKDWLYDSTGREHMSYDLFQESLFEIADLFCPRVSSQEYAEFLMEIEKCISKPEPVKEMSDKHVEEWKEAGAMRSILRELSDISKFPPEPSDKSSEAWIKLFPVSTDDASKLSFKQCIAMYHEIMHPYSEKATVKGIEACLGREPEQVFRVSHTMNNYRFNANAINVEANIIKQDSWDEDCVQLEIANSRPPYITVLGPPLSGKTTTAKNLAEVMDLPFICDSEILEEAILSASGSIEETQDETAEEQTPDGTKDIFSAKRKEIIHSLLSDLREGKAVPRSSVRGLVLLRVFEIIKAGEGFVIDGIPAEDFEVSKMSESLQDIQTFYAEDSIPLSYIVQLDFSEENVFHRLQGIRVCAATRDRFSRRELSQFDINCVEFGFSPIFPLKAQDPVMTVEELEESERRKKILEDMGEEGETSGLGSPNEVDETEGGDEDSEEKRDMEALLKSFECPKKIPARIGPDYNMLLSVESLLHRFTMKQMEVYNSDTTSLRDGQCIVMVNAIQSSQDLLEEVSHKISGGFPPFSINCPSLRAVPLELPAQLEDTDRSEQIKWLLYNDLKDVEISDSMAKYIVKNEPRRLSVFKEMCPVTWKTSKKMQEGQPGCGAVFGGKIYLMKDKTSLDEFIKNPKQFLKEQPIRAPRRKFWVMTNTLSSYSSRPKLHELCAELAVCMGIPAQNVIDVTQCVQEYVKDPDNKKHTTAVLKGSALTSEKSLKCVATKLNGLSEDKWVLYNTCNSNSNAVEVFNELKKNNCVPDCVLSLEDEKSDSQVHVTNQDSDENLPDFTDYFSSIRVPSLACQEYLMSPEHFESLKEACKTAKTEFITEIPLFDHPTDSVSYICSMLDPLWTRIDSYEPDTEQDSGGDTDGEMDSMSRKIRWGETGPFCPVTWKKHHRLVPSSKEHVLYVAQKKYAFLSENEKRLFSLNPSRYIPSSSVLNDSLPIVLLEGVSGSGKSSHTKALVESFGAVMLDDNAVQEHFERLVIITQDEMDTTEILDMETRVALWTKAVHCEWMRVQHNNSNNNNEERSRVERGAKCLVLNGLQLGRARWNELCEDMIFEALVEFGMYPTAVIPIQVLKESVVERLIQNWVFNVPLAETEGEERDESFDLEQATLERRQEECSRISSVYDTELEQIAVVVERCKELGIDVLNGVNSTFQNIGRMQKNIQHQINSNILAVRESYCERPRALRLQEAASLLRSGYATVGKFRLKCPISYAQSNPEHKTSLRHPVLYRERIYFPSSELYQRQFLRNIVSFFTDRTLNTRSGSIPAEIPCCCVVVGSKYSGKTTLARQISTVKGSVYLSVDSVLEWVDTYMGGNVLWKDIHKSRQKNLEMVDEMIVEALKLRVSSKECQIKGWVLEGFPKTLNQAKLMVQEGIFPMAVFLVQFNVHTLHKRSEYRNVPIHKNSVLLRTMKEWNYQHLDIVEYFIREFGEGVLQQLSNPVSIWQMTNDALEVLHKKQRDAERCWEMIASGQAASMESISLPRSTLMKMSSGDIGCYCPVNLYKEQYVWSDVNDRKHLMYFKGLMYWLASSIASQEFISKPDMFLADNYESLVQSAPFGVSVGSTNLVTMANHFVCNLQGYCPVTYALGNGPHDWTCIEKGSIFCIASYQGQMYTFVDETCRQRFLFEPKRFVDLTLPAKLPPIVHPHRETFQSLLGHFEEKLSSDLERALVSVAEHRVKYPGVTPQTSAIYYLALLLKTSNDELRRRAPIEAETAATRFKQFVEDCALRDDLRDSSLDAARGTAVKGVRTVHDWYFKSDRYDELLTKSTKLVSQHITVITSKSNAVDRVSCKETRSPTSTRVNKNE